MVSKAKGETWMSLVIEVEGRPTCMLNANALRILSDNSVSVERVKRYPEKYAIARCSKSLRSFRLTLNEGDAPRQRLHRVLARTRKLHNAAH